MDKPEDILMDCSKKFNEASPEELNSVVACDVLHNSDSTHSSFSGNGVKMLTSNEYNTTIKDCNITPVSVAEISDCLSKFGLVPL